MAAFIYVTQNSRGEPFVSGKIFGPHYLEALEKLLERGIPVVELRRARADSLPLANRRISLRDKLDFAEKLEAALYLRMPIDRALLSTIGQTSLDAPGPPQSKRRTASKRNLEAVVIEITRKVIAGKKLFELAELFPNLFDPVAKGLIQAGESSGTLDVNLRSWRESLQRSDKWIHEFRMLLVYPSIVLFMAALVVGFLTTVLVPTYKQFLSEIGRELPTPTKIVVAISDVCVNYPYIVVPVVVLCGIGLVSLPLVIRQTPSLHRIALQLPLFGGLNRLALQTNFIRTFARLKSVGVKLDEALLLCQEISWNWEYKAAIARAIKLVREGKPFGRALASDVDILGEDNVDYLRFTEEEGAPPDSLFRLAELIDRQLNARIELVKIWVNPLLTLVMAVIVGFVMAATYLPYLSFL
jgi:type II secretory pathway component PulF